MAFSLLLISKDNFIQWLGIGVAGYAFLSVILTLLYGHALNKIFKLGGIFGMGRLLIAIIVLIFGAIWWLIKKAVGASKDATPRQTIEHGIQKVGKFTNWVDEQWKKGTVSTKHKDDNNTL